MISPVHLKLFSLREHALEPVATFLTIAAFDVHAYGIARGRGHRRRATGFASAVCRGHRSPADALRVLRAVMRSHNVEFYLGFARLVATLEERAAL